MALLDKTFAQVCAILLLLINTTHGCMSTATQESTSVGACTGPDNSAGLFIQKGTWNVYPGHDTDVLENGVCYEPATADAYVDLIPYCDAGGCHVYAVPFIAPSHSANVVYGPLQTTKGKIYHAPGEITTGYPTVPIGSKSGHIKAKSISCGSCSKLKSEQKNLGCSGAGKDGTTTAKPAHVRSASASCSCDSGSQQFFKPTNRPIPNESFLSSKLAFALDTVKNCKNLCICDGIDTQNCYVGQTANTYIQFVPYCSGGHCYIYAAPYDATFSGVVYKGVQNARSGAAYSSPDPYTVPVSPDSNYLKVSSISCSGCKGINAAQCFGPTA
uniref:Uncharacterized protein n=1 Tax=Acrobeloides nanus TaxID=290746 RepID=A0A914D8U6_9BILA